MTVISVYRSIVSVHMRGILIHVQYLLTVSGRKPLLCHYLSFCSQARHSCATTSELFFVYSILTVSVGNLTNICVPIHDEIGYIKG